MVHMFWRKQLVLLFSPSPASSAKHKAKLRCFRSIFDDDVDEQPGIRQDAFEQFPFVSTLLRYLLSISNEVKPFFTCQMMDAALATLVSPIVTNPVLSELEE